MFADKSMGFDNNQSFSKTKTKNGNNHIKSFALERVLSSW